MLNATYSPDDNKLRLYASARLDAETYAKVKAAGFRWAPKQDLFVAPMWTPQREDLLVELAGEIGDEDTSLAERAEERAERFEEYQEKRAGDAEQARAAVARIADGIPFGQPILVGHHSERHARKDAERIENGMRRAVKMWETSQYWQDRARGAIRHAKYKERPDVRARRIKKLEAEQRKVTKSKAQGEQALKLWASLPELQMKKQDGSPTTFHERVVYVAGHSFSSYGVYSDLTAGKITPEEARDRSMKAAQVSIAWADRWLTHYTNRLSYEREMLAEVGGTVADRTRPEVGGACRCWCSPGYGEGWSIIQKVNKVTVSVLDNWGNGGRNFTRTIPFDKLRGIMTAAEVQQAREDGRLTEADSKTGFYLGVPAAPKPKPEATPGAEDFAAMRDSLRAGVKVVSAPALFPTPPDLARRMVELADIQFDNRVLEPSAGTGNLVDAILRRAAASQGVELMAVEKVHALAADIAGRFGISCLCGDFLECNGDLKKFDRVIMNPPFTNGEDIKHITHALTFLRPGGRLVALCADGPRQQAQLQPLADSWEELAPGTFAGTGVRAALLTIHKED